MDAMTSVVFDGTQDIIGQTREHGFFEVDSFFDPAVVAEARAEMAALLDRDVETRKTADDIKGFTRLDRGQFKTTLTDKMHTRFFPSWESPTFARMAGDLFSHPSMVAFRREILGEHIRLRIDLIRRASGINDVIDDFQLPHAWHRDTPGEFTFGIFFDDLETPDSGGTGVVPGTHLEARDPRWELLLAEDGMPTREQYLAGLRHLPPGIWDRAPLNREARESLRGRTHEIRGRAGGIYFFFNDTWHGRFGNSSGRRHMIARIGGFATEFAFKDDIPLPADGECLDARLSDFYRADSPANTSSDTLVQEMRRRGSSPHFEAAAREKLALLDGIDIPAAILAHRAELQAAKLKARADARAKAQAEALEARARARAEAQAKALAEREARRKQAGTAPR